MRCYQLLIYTAKLISDVTSLPEEILHLETTFPPKNGCPVQEVRRALTKSLHKSNGISTSIENNNKAIARVPYYSSISSKIGWMLAKHGVQTIFKPPAKIQQMLRPIKADLGFKQAAMYHIPCECRRSYFGQTGMLIAKKCKGHQRHIKCKQPEKSGLV